MTAASSLRGAVPHFLLKFDGQDAPLGVMRQLRELTVESSLHLPDVATVLLRDTDVKLIDDDSLGLGAKLQISVEVDGKSGSLFDGEIVEVEPHFERHDQYLLLRAFDRLHRLGRGTQTRSFQNVSDMDLVRKIAAENGLQARVGPASFVHEYVFQNNQTNLAFLQERAASLGYLLYVDGTTLHCEPPGAQEDAVKLKWGENLAEFIPRLSSLDQPGKTTARGWDPQTKKAVVGQASSAEGTPKTGEKRKTEDAAKPFGMQPAHTLTHQVVRQQGLADAYAQAHANRAGERLIEATGVCGGNPAITAGVPVQVSAVGDRFGGVYFVSSATHSYHVSRGYQTEFTVSGQRPSTVAGALGAGKREGGQRGLAVGIVTNNQDPKGQGRVKVKYPGLTEEHESDWARVVSPGGGQQRGLELLPEVNDEVLVGFELGDIHHPYVLGGLWNGVDSPPKKNDELVKNGKVVQRIYRSRLGHWLVFDDTDGKAYVQLQSAAGHQIKLSDESGAESILIQDKAGNQVKIDTGKGTLSVQVQGDVKVNATGNATVQAGMLLKAEATDIELSGSASVKINGGVVEVTGGLIKLN